MNARAVRLADAGLLVGLAAWAAAPARAHPAASLELLDPAGGKRLRSVELAVPATATTASRILFLRRSAGGLALTGLRLVAEVDSGRATLVPLDGPNPLSLGPAPSTVPVQLTVTFERTRFGAVRGRLLAIGANRPVVLAALAVSRAREPAVTILQAGATGLAVSARSPSLRFPVQVQANEAGASRLTVSIGDLRSESGQLQQVTVGRVEPRTLGANGIARTVVTATLPEPGTYTSTIVVGHDGRKAPAVPLVVTRTRSAPPVDMDGTGQVELVRWPTAKAGVDFILTENAGGQVTLAPPTLVNLGRADADVNPQPRETRVEVLVRDQGTEDWAPVPSDGIVVSRRPKEIRFELPGVRYPGTYTATAKVREPGGTSIDKPVKVFVRYPLGLLWVAVLAGIALSYVVGVVVTRARLRAIMLRRLSEVVIDLDGALKDRSVADDQQVKELVDALLGTEQRLRDRVRQRGDPHSLTTQVDRLERRAAVAPTWIRLHLLIAGLEPATLLVEEHDKLGTLWASLMDENTTVEELSEVAEELRELDATIAAKLLKELHDRLQSLTRQLEDEDSFLTDTQRASLPAVREQLDRARRALRAYDYATASEALTNAQERFANLLVLDLEAYVENLPDWSKGVSKEAVMTKLQGAGPVSERYRAALRVLLELQTDEAREKAETLDPQRRAEVEKFLDGIPPLLAADQLREARDLLAKAVQAAQEFKKAQFRSIPALRKGRAVPSGADLPTPVLVPPTPDLRARAAAARADLGTLAARERALALISLGVAVVVALTLATVLLYTRTWGTWQDIGTAILWGLGIQAGSSFTFLGIGQLQAQLEGTTPAKPA